MFRNLFAGMTNSIWSALIGLAVVPLYLKYLGIEVYGLVGFFATMQSVLQLFDMGLAPTINREVARLSATGNIKESGTLLHTLAIVYWCMGLIIALGVISLAPFIAGFWLRPINTSQHTIEHAVMFMGIIIASHWPIALYQGALIGAQRLSVASRVSISMSTLGSIGAVGILAFVSPTIEAFFLWQAGIGIIHVTVMRLAAWSVVGRSEKVRFDLSELKRIWRFSAGMTGVAVSGLVLMQLDKVLLSRILSLEDFGRYTLAGVLASGLYMILTPTFNVIYPRLSSLVILEDSEKLIELYRNGTRLLLAVLFPIASAAAVFSEQLLVLWTGNPAMASTTAPVVSLLLVGTALNGAMHFPYALQLAFGMTRLPLVINSILVCLMIPMTIYLALHFGAIGGAAAWVLLNCVYLFIGSWLTHRSLIKGICFDWLLHDIGIPFCLSFMVVVLLGHSIKSLEFSPVIDVCFGVGLSIAAFVCIVLFSSKLKDAMKSSFNGRML